MCFDCSLFAVGGDSVEMNLRILFSFLFVLPHRLSSHIFIEHLKHTLVLENPDHVLIPLDLLINSFS